MSSSEYENFSINDPNHQNSIQDPPHNTKKSLIIYISIIFLFILMIILILFFILKSKDNNKDNENLPTIYIENIKNLKYCSFAILSIKCYNLNFYKEITNKDISFLFTTIDSSNNYFSNEIIEDIIKVTIPFEAISGNVIINIKK